jgi:hypothetical protein
MADIAKTCLNSEGGVPMPLNFGKLEKFLLNTFPIEWEEIVWMFILQSQGK